MKGLLQSVKDYLLLHFSNRVNPNTAKVGDKVRGRSGICTITYIPPDKSWVRIEYQDFGSTISIPTDWNMIRKN